VVCKTEETNKSEFEENNRTKTNSDKRYVCKKVLERVSNTESGVNVSNAYFSSRSTP